LQIKLRDNYSNTTLMFSFSLADVSNLKVKRLDSTNSFISLLSILSDEFYSPLFDYKRSFLVPTSTRSSSLPSA
jgi:hypothetical protein